MRRRRANRPTDSLTLAHWIESISWATVLREDVGENKLPPTRLVPRDQKTGLQILHDAVVRAVVIGPLWLLLHRAPAAIWRDPLVRSGLL